MSPASAFVPASIIVSIPVPVAVRGSSPTSLACVLLFILLSVVSPTALGQSAGAQPLPRTLEEAAAQRDQASRLRDAAEETHAAESAACYKKFLVNDCLADAKQRYTQSMIEARKLDMPARDFQRETRRAELDAKAAQRAADLAKRKAKQQIQANKFRAEQAAKAAAREKKLAERAARQSE